jgi:hypothetical protein
MDFRPDKIPRVERQSHDLFLELVPTVDLAFESFNDQLFRSVTEALANLVQLSNDAGREI